MMIPVAIAASLRHPLPGPTATTAEEGVKRRYQLARPDCDTQPTSPWAGSRQSPAEEITPTSTQANSHTSYPGTPTTTTQLSQQVDR
jgi:hypothetical protein